MPMGAGSFTVCMFFFVSDVGAAMVPVSWCEMQCPKTKAKEHRKVAKVQQAAS